MAFGKWCRSLRGHLSDRHYFDPVFPTGMHHAGVPRDALFGLCVTCEVGHVLTNLAFPGFPWHLHLPQLKSWVKRVTFRVVGGVPIIKNWSKAGSRQCVRLPLHHLKPETAVLVPTPTRSDSRFPPQRRHVLMEQERSEKHEKMKGKVRSCRECVGGVKVPVVTDAMEGLSESFVQPHRRQHRSGRVELVA